MAKNKKDPKIDKDAHSILTKLLNHFLSFVDGVFIEDYQGLKMAWIEGREIIWRRGPREKSAVSTYIEQYRRNFLKINESRELSKKEIKEQCFKMVQISKWLSVSFPNKKDEILELLKTFLIRVQDSFKLFLENQEIDDIVYNLDRDIQKEYNKQKAKIERMDKPTEEIVTSTVKPQKSIPKWHHYRKYIILFLIIILITGVYLYREPLLDKISKH